MKKLRFGLIGCGKIANRHLDSIQNYSDRAEMVALCDTDGKRLKEFANLYKIRRTYRDYKQLVSQKDIDIIAVCTPNGLHKQMALATAKAGKHALVEKPLALKSKDVARMIQAFKKNNLQLFAVLQVRHNPPVKFLRNFLKQKGLGKVHYATLTIRWFRPQEYFQESWRGTKKLDGGTLLNQGIHYIDVLQWTVGMPKKVQAKTLRLAHQIEIEDTAFGIFELKNGSWASVEFTLCNYPQNNECSLTVVGEKGNLQIGGQALNEITAWNVPGTVKPTLEPSIEPNVYAGGMYQGSCPYHFLVYQDLLDTLQKGQRNPIDGRQAIRSIQIIEAMYQASKSKKEVKIGVK